MVEVLVLRLRRASSTIEMVLNAFIYHSQLVCIKTFQLECYCAPPYPKIYCWQFLAILHIFQCFYTIEWKIFRGSVTSHTLVTSRRSTIAPDGVEYRISQAFLPLQFLILLPMMKDLTKSCKSPLLYQNLVWVPCSTMFRISRYQQVWQNVSHNLAFLVEYNLSHCNVHNINSRVELLFGFLRYSLSLCIHTKFISDGDWIQHSHHLAKGENLYQIQ